MGTETKNIVLPPTADFDARHAVLAFLVALALDSDQHRDAKLALPVVFRMTLAGFPGALAVVERVRSDCAESIAATLEELLAFVRDATTKPLNEASIAAADSTG